MEKTNIKYLKIKLEFALGKSLKNETRFSIQIDDEDKDDIKSNVDEIMNRWVLPKAKNKMFNLDEVCNLLTTVRNEIPLYIKVKNFKDSKFQLTISKRFRKRKVVEKWHEGNQLKPLIFE